MIKKVKTNGKDGMRVDTIIFSLCSSSCEILGEALHMIGLGESGYERQFGK